MVRYLAPITLILLMTLFDYSVGANNSDDSEENTETEETCTGNSCETFYFQFLNEILLRKPEDSPWESIEPVSAAKYFSKEIPTPIRTIRTAFVTCMYFEFNTKDKCEALFDQFLDRKYTIETVADYCSRYPEVCKENKWTLSRETEIKLQIRNLKFYECLNYVKGETEHIVVDGLRLANLLQTKGATHKNRCSCGQLKSIGEMYRNVHQEKSGAGGTNVSHDAVISENVAPEDFDSLISSSCITVINGSDRLIWSAGNISSISHRMGMYAKRYQDPIEFMKLFLSQDDVYSGLIQSMHNTWSASDMIAIAYQFDVPPNEYPLAIQLFQLAIQHGCPMENFKIFLQLTEDLPSKISNDRLKTMSLQSQKLKLRYDLFQFMVGRNEGDCENLVDLESSKTFNDVIIAFTKSYT